MMRTAAFIAALLVASVAHAERDPEFEAGLTQVSVEGNQVLPGPTYSRPQLVVHDTKTATTIGTAAGLIGGLSLVGGWVLYVGRQNERLKMRQELTADAIRSWETIGTWSLTLTGFASANLITSEALLLDGSKPPAPVWLGSVAGVGVAAIGLGFVVGGTHCGPLAYKEGATWPVACQSGTADALFGWNLLLSSLPLIALPITYWVRGLFAEQTSLTLGPGSVTARVVF